jgi:hypothetical protein
MTTERSVPERLAIRVLRSADCALRSTDGELVRGLSTEVRPTTDLHLLDSEQMTGNTKVGLKSSGLSANRRLRWFAAPALVKQVILGDVGSLAEVRRALDRG